MVLSRLSRPALRAKGLVPREHASDLMADQMLVAVRIPQILILNSVIPVTFTRAKPWEVRSNPTEVAMREFLVLVLALTLAGGAATMVRAADRLPTPVVAADYSGASW